MFRRELAHDEYVPTRLSVARAGPVESIRLTDTSALSVLGDVASDDVMHLRGPLLSGLDHPSTGVLLSAWRTRRGDSPSTAARRFSVSTATYKSWEQGDHDLTDRILMALSRDLRVPVYQLQEWTGRHPQDLPPPSTWTAGALPALLRGWRRRQGLSARELSRRLGVAPGTVDNWESGAVPHPRHIPAIARLFGTSASDVRNAAGPDRVRRPNTTGGPDSTPLAKARHTLGLSLATLGGRVGVSPSTLSRWEGGERGPHNSLYPALALALECSIADVHRMFAEYSTSVRNTVGPLPGLGAMLKDRDMGVEDLARATGADTAIAAEWASGRRPVPYHVVSHIEELIGMRFADQRETLRRRRAPGRGTESPLRRRRMQQGLTQSELAQRIGIAPNSIGCWEVGHRNPNVTQVRVLSRVLECSPAELGRELGVAIPQKPDPEQWLQRDLGGLLCALRQASGLTKAQVGRCVGRTSSTVRNWELGRTTPPSHVRVRLAQLYAVNPVSLERIVYVNSE